jgi:serine/threonine protein phosphatase PrpC
MAALADALHAKAEELKEFRDTIAPMQSGKHIFEACTSIGLRPTQEDRFVLIPKFYHEECSFCGVFDGTVGDDASDYINQNIVSHLCKNLDIQSGNTSGIFHVPATESDGKPAAAASTTGSVSDEVAEKLRNGIRSTFLSADRALIEMCAEKQLHYASSTGVTAFLWKNLLTVAHIGDSKVRIDMHDVHCAHMHR